MTATSASVLPQLRRISIIEAVSYLILLLAALMKRLDVTELGVQIFGPVHGVLFLIFAAMVLRDFRPLGWPLWRAIAAIFVGSLPLGGFWLERQWLCDPS